MKPSTIRDLGKGALLVGTIMGASVLILVGGIVVWFKTNEARIQQDAAAAAYDGSTYGRVNSQTECVDAAITRAEQCPANFVCEVNAGIFLEQCMGTADPVLDLCDGAPARHDDEIAKAWHRDMCGRHGGDSRDARCIDLIRRMHAEFCTPLLYP